MARSARKVRRIFVALLLGGVTGGLVLADLGALDVFAEGGKGLTEGFVKRLKRFSQDLRIVIHFATSSIALDLCSNEIEGALTCTLASMGVPHFTT